jgi:WD40 repeat protein
MEQRLLSHSQWAHDLAFSPDSTSIFTGSGYIGDDTTDTRDYNARAWPLARGGEPVVMPHDQAVGAVRPLQDGRYLVTAGWFYMGVWDLSQQRAVARIECETPHDELEGAQIAFALSRDGRLLACHTDDERIQVFAIHNGQRVGPEHTGDGAVTGIALNDDGSLLAMERGQTLEIIEVNAKPKPVARAELETEGAMLAFIPGTDRLAVVSESGVRLFDVKRKAWDALRIDEPIDVLPRISPDGRRIVLAKGNRASVWDLTSGRRLIHLAHPVEIKDSDLSRDGRFLATAGLDGVARVWDLATGREQVRLAASSNRSDDSASRVVFSPDGRFLATKHGFDVRVWQIRPEDLRAEACRRVRGNLTAAERTEYISAADACTPTCAAFPACSQGESAAPPRVMK